MTRKTPLWRLAAVAGAASLVLAACGGDDDGDDTTEPAAEGTTAEETGGEEDGTGEASGEFTPTPFTFGALLPQTGQLAQIVSSLEAGIELAVEDVNAASSDLITSWDIADSGTQPQTASENVDTFLTGEYNAIMGAAASGVTTSIVEKVSDAQMGMCSGSTTAASLSAYDPYFSRTAPTDELQAPTLGDLIIGDGHTSVAVVWRNDEYGQGFGDLLTSYLESSGVEVAFAQGYDPNISSFSDLLTQVADSGASALAAITFAEGGQMVLDSQGVFDGQLYVADGFVDTVGEEQLGGDVSVLEGIRGTYPSSAPPNGEETFPDRFAEAYPDTPTIFSAHFYDCVIVTTLAIQAAGSAEPADYVEEIVGVTKDGEKCSLFADCLELLEAGEDIDYDGASGPLEFLPAAEPGAGTYELFEFGADGTRTVEDQVLTEATSSE